MEDARDDIRLMSFLYFSWASCSNEFKGYPLSIIQLNWLAVCTPLECGFHRKRPSWFLRSGSNKFFFDLSFFTNLLAYQRFLVVYIRFV